MIKFSQIDSSVNDISFSEPLKSLLVLRISLKSNFLAPAIIQPKINNWIRSDGSIFPVVYKILPAYIYISPGAEASMTITLQTPENIISGDVLQSVIQFSGYKNSSVKIKLTVCDNNNSNNDVREHSLELAVPFHSSTKDNNEDVSLFRLEHAAKIMGSLAGLEIIPAKWLIVELVLSLCERGFYASEQKETQDLIDKLKRTQFFKNGVLAIASSQFLHWIMTGLSISSGIQAATGNNLNTTCILHFWEEWLFSLIDKDLEALDYSSIDLQFPNQNKNEEIIEKLGMEPERWFLFLLLGLIQISPRINSIIHQLANNIPKAKPKPVKKKNSAKKILKEKGSLQR